jgi:hypothetical protein
MDMILHVPKGGKATGPAAAITPTTEKRRGQIPIAPAAPSLPNPPRFPALALFSRRPIEHADSLVIAGS